MSSVQFSIESDAGSITLEANPDDQPTGYRLGAGTEGLGLPPSLVRTTASARGGGVVRSRRVGIRDAVLAIDTYGTSREHTDERLRLLGRILRASPVLVADIPGEDVYRLPFERTGGGDGGYDDGGDLLVSWVLDVQAAQPYWVGDKAVTVEVSQGTAGTVGLLPELAKLPVSPSAAMGELFTTNPGDVPSPINWRITGPATGPATVSIGGRGFTLTGALAAGEFVMVRRTAAGWRVTDQTGANAYQRLGPAPKFPMAPSGEVRGVASLQLAAAGAGITGWFSPMREVIH